MTAPGVSRHSAARVAGALYVLTNLTAIAGFLIRQSLAGADTAATTEIILASERLYRLSIAIDLATVAGVVVLVWGLYVLTQPVNRDLALLGAFLRLMENAVLAVMAVLLLLNLRIIAQPDYLAGFDAGSLQATARLLRGAHGLGFTVGFLFLGLGSAVFASLLYRGRIVPRPLAGFGVAASSLMAVCSLLMMVFPDAAVMLQYVSFAPMGIYEITVGAWLFVKA